ncbi:YfcC family protein [Plebeiibacterium marinum]|uniref:AbgT family transporter n=1 Tax=Plebeiibacterium marinum TaxID=2992111 RepID=A0AAE3MEM5_9BACT|nr:Na+/H+ antiporter NhaC family protein [Plebeiobacterium marinum]MCW3806202.1 AbgT family transporter [Plebeiobacterium marinum]
MKHLFPKSIKWSALKFPHVFILLAGVILFCSILTYLIPSGSYQRIQEQYGSSEKTIVIPDSYKQIPKHYSISGILLGKESDTLATPVSILQLLSAIPRGMTNASSIIFFLFIIGGTFGILQKSGTIVATIQALVHRFSDSGPLLTTILMICIGIGGSTIGMGEELIPLIPIFIITATKLGYDRIYGFSIVTLAAGIGFAASTTNPFTVQIAQGIAEVPIGSGMLPRIIFFVLCMATTLWYVLRYGKKIKNNPQRSVVADIYIAPDDSELQKIKLSWKHIWISIFCTVIFLLMLYFIQEKGWWINEMSAAFLLMGIGVAIISGLSLSEANRHFIKGMEEMLVPAMVVGFAKGIQVVLEDGQIMDTIIYYAATYLQQFPKIVAAEGMLVFQSLLNFFIPSGSGQAAVTMPLMAPLADILGITRQTAVLAFTLGDGFTNEIIPTSGLLMAMLSLANIPYVKWIRFVYPLFLLLMLYCFLFMAIAVLVGY